MVADARSCIRLPEGVSAYLAGGYLDGSSRPLPNLITGKKDDLSGWYVAGGIEAFAPFEQRLGIAEPERLPVLPR